MDKTIRKLAAFEQAKNEEHRYRQSIPPNERLRASYQMNIEGYRANNHAAYRRELRQLMSAFNANHVRADTS